MNALANISRNDATYVNLNFLTVTKGVYIFFKVHTSSIGQIFSIYHVLSSQSRTPPGAAFQNISLLYTTEPYMIFMSRKRCTQNLFVCYMLTFTNWFDEDSVCKNESSLYECIFRAPMSDKKNLVWFTTIVSVNKKHYQPSSCTVYS